jgi:hypothetical protein
MSCPFYEDYTRGCAEKFKGIIYFITYDVCTKEDEYKNCILYNVIVENKPMCPVLEKCTEHFQKLSMKIIMKLMINDKILEELNLDEYCFSNNYINCARYTIIKSGKKVSDSLRPNGTEMTLKELIFKGLK